MARGKSSDTVSCFNVRNMLRTMIYVLQKNTMVVFGFLK